MNRGFRILGIGVVAVLVAGIVWWPAFGLSGGPAAFLTQTGVLFVVIGLLDVVSPARVRERPLLLAGLSLIILYVVLVGALYLNAHQYSESSLRNVLPPHVVLLNRLSRTLLLGAISMGYPVAIEHLRGNTGLPGIGWGVVSWALSFGLLFARGLASHGGLAFTTVLYLMYVPAILVGAGILYAVCITAPTETPRT